MHLGCCGRLHSRQQSIFGKMCIISEWGCSSFKHNYFKNDIKTELHNAVQEMQSPVFQCLQYFYYLQLMNLWEQGMFVCPIPDTGNGTHLEGFWSSFHSAPEEDQSLNQVPKDWTNTELQNNPTEISVFPQCWWHPFRVSGNNGTNTEPRQRACPKDDNNFLFGLIIGRSWSCFLFFWVELYFLST